MLLFFELVQLTFYTIYEYFFIFLGLIFPRKKNYSFSGKRVLITGAGNGLGQLMSIEFAKLGAEIIGWDINKIGLEETARKIRELPINATIKSFGDVSTQFSYDIVDVSDSDSVYETAKKTGYIDILINNAGIRTSNRPIQEKSDKEIINTFNVNVLSQFWTLKAFLPRMIERKSGHIVTMASVAGMIGTPCLSDYSASKFAVIGLHEAMDLELRGEGLGHKIHTTLVCPYVIKTDLFTGATKNRVHLAMPILDTTYAVDKIIEAIAFKDAKCVLPKFGSFVSALKMVVPWESWARGIDVFGIHRIFANLR